MISEDNFNKLVEFVDKTYKLVYGDKDRNFHQKLTAVMDRLQEVNYVPFPVSFSTVDVAVITTDMNDENKKLMLGRKPGQTHFQFIGGFRDPGETSVEAAIRELKEESSLELRSHYFNQIMELPIDDPRYRESAHKITTSVFIAEIYHPLIEGKYSPADDIEELQFFDLNYLIDNYRDVVREVHHRLFNIVVNNC